MTISSKIKTFLEKENVKYEVSEHALAYTAAEVAGTQHVPGKQMVKSVIVKSDGEFMMCVLPAIHLIDFEKLRDVTGASSIILAEEEEIGKLFPDYDLGAEPPFGQLYGLEVYADKILEEDDQIIFNAGTHTDVVKIAFTDFKRIVNPIIADIGTHI